MRYIIITVPHAACYSQQAAEYRICDRRAYAAAMHIYNKLNTLLDKTQVDVVMFPNLNVLRSTCDTNRPTACVYRTIKDEVAAFVNEKGADSVVMNLDVHSYPTENDKPLDFYALLLDNSEAVKQSNRQLLFSFFRMHKGTPLVAYQGSQLNYFLTYFAQLGKVSILVEFNENSGEYPDSKLAADAALWALFVKTMTTHLTKAK